MNDGMLKEAMDLGGKPTVWQGQIYARVPVKGPGGGYWVISLNFYSWNDLATAHTALLSKGFVPFEDVPNLTGKEETFGGNYKDSVPSCPVHGTRFIAKSKKRPGSWYCEGRVKGGYCNWETD